MPLWQYDQDPAGTFGNLVRWHRECFTPDGALISGSTLELLDDRTAFEQGILGI